MDSSGQRAIRLILRNRQSLLNGVSSRMAFCRLIQDADRKETARRGLQPPHPTATEAALTPFRPLLTASYKRAPFRQISIALRQKENC